MPSRSHTSADLATEVWTGLQAFVRAHQRSGEVQEALGLGAGAGRVVVLYRLVDGPMTLREIAAAHHVDAPYATIIVDKLESLGLVRRVPHPTDGRRKLVALTPAGEEAVVIARRIHAEPPAALAGLAPADLRQLSEIVARLGRC